MPMAELEGKPGEVQRFAVDWMLGRLARWLRILGHDVAYGRHLRDRTLVDSARREERLLLTRDTRLLRDPHLPRHLFVESDHFREQLRQVAAATCCCTSISMIRERRIGSASTATRRWIPRRSAGSRSRSSLTSVTACAGKVGDAASPAAGRVAAAGGDRQARGGRSNMNERV